MKNIISTITNNADKLLLLLFFCIYLVTLRGLPSTPVPDKTNTININVPPFESSLERGRYAQIFALVYNKTFAVDAYKDFVKPDIAWYGGHYFPAFPPGTVLLSVPAFIIGQQFHLGQVFAYGMTTVTSIVTGFFLLQICRKLKLSKQTGLFTVLIYLFSSMVWSYSVTLSAHPLSALLITLLLYLYIQLDEKKNNFLVFSLIWLFYGLNFFVDYPNLLIASPLVIASVIRLIKVKLIRTDYKINFSFTPLYAIYPMIFILSIFSFYSFRYYHQPFVFTNTYNLQVLTKQGITVDESKLTNNIFKKVTYAKRFTAEQAIIGVQTLLVSQDRGLFFFFPIFLLAMIGIFWLKKYELWLVILAIFFLDLIVYGSFDDPWGGWAFGPRYLIVSLPLIAVTCGVAFEKLASSMFGFLWKTICALLFIYSSAIALLGAITTNAVPPSVEAPSLHIPDNFMLNFDYLQQGKIYSYSYITYFNHLVSPLDFYLWVFAIVLILGALIIYYPTKKKREEYV